EAEGRVEGRGVIERDRVDDVQRAVASDLRRSQRHRGGRVRAVVADGAGRDRCAEGDRLAVGAAARQGEDDALAVLVGRVGRRVGAEERRVVAGGGGDGGGDGCVGGAAAGVAGPAVAGRRGQRR